MKKIFIILLCLTLTGCFFSKKQNDDKIRIYLSDKYYNEGKFIDVKNLDNLNDDTYILFIYNPYCNLPVPCEEIFKSFMKKYKIDFIEIPFSEFKNTNYYNKVKYAPSIIIIKNKEIIDYLDANSDEDLKKYQELKEFERWIDNYVYFGK